MKRLTPGSTWWHTLPHRENARNGARGGCQPWEYVGIDLHKKESQICLLAEAGETVANAMAVWEDGAARPGSGARSVVLALRTGACAAGQVAPARLNHPEKETRMSTLSFRMATVLLALGALALSATVAIEVRAQAPAVDPAAVQRLKQMTEFLDGLQQFSVQTQNTLEEMHVSGHRVDRYLAANVTVKRPNKMRAVRTSGLTDQRLFYDGKTVTLYNPAQKVYATEAAPDTVEKMIDFARETVGILLPAADLIYRNAFPLLMQDVTLAVMVGKTAAGGVRYDHLLFSRPGVDFQIWIAEGKRPFPRLYIVTETDTPALLSITTILSDWKTDGAVDDAQFTFVPPKGTSAIRFLPHDAPGVSGR